MRSEKSQLHEMKKRVNLSFRGSSANRGDAHPTETGDAITETGDAAAHDTRNEPSHGRTRCNANGYKYDS